MKTMKMGKLLTLFIVVFTLICCFSLNVLATDRYTQDDPNNATKFSIDGDILDGYSTPDLYIGTLGSYMGSAADGKTPLFTEGSALSPYDILIMNDKVAIILAVATPDPWGYPGGSILDAGRVTVASGATNLEGAQFGKSTTLTTQFLFDGWDSWAPINAGVVSFDLVNYDFENQALNGPKAVAAVRVERKMSLPYVNDPNTNRDCDVISYYSIPADAEYAYMFDTVKNNGSDFGHLYYGNEISLSNRGGDGIDSKTVFDLQAANTYNWQSYDGTSVPTRQFSTAVITPGENPGDDGRNHPLEKFDGAVGYREFIFEDNDYVAGETRLYESYVLIDDEASWQGIYDFWADYNNKDTFTMAGNVKNQAGAAVPYAAVIVYKGDEFYGWVMADKDGKYSATLPKLDNSTEYHFRVESYGTAQSPNTETFTALDAATNFDLTTGTDLIPITFNFKDQNGDPTWGRVFVGDTRTIAFTGQNYFMADNDKNGTPVKGKVTALVAPGNYSATCYGEGYGFYSYTDNNTTYSKTITSNTSAGDQTVTINKTLSAPTDWFGTDNHHHGQRADAFTPPEIVAKAETTAGLEVLSLDDHEFVIDNAKVYDWAVKLDAYGYMPSEEITSSWAHFDPMPLTEESYARWLDRDQKNDIINTNQSLKGILQEGHDSGITIGANHPNYSYGMLLADTLGTIPGGLVDDFDNLEINSSLNVIDYGAYKIGGADYIEAMDYWDAYLTGVNHRGLKVTRPHYVRGGSDIHNSGLSTKSGTIRSYVYVEDGAAKSEADFDAFSLEFSRNNAAGMNYVSTGALIEPLDGKIFGNTYSVDKNGDFTAKFKFSAISPIRSIYVFTSDGIGVVGSGLLKGYTHLEQQIDYTGSKTSVTFTLNLKDIEDASWVALGVVTEGGKGAVSNPLWLNGTPVSSISYASEDVDSEYTVAKSIATGEVIARSWYNEDQDLVSAKLAVYLPYEAVTVTPQSFSDTNSKWMDTAVKYLRARGVAQGVGNNLFVPNSSITRAEFVTLLMRVIDWPADSQNTVTFKDDDSIPAWAKDAVATAASLGIVKGDDRGNFNPNATITRQDLFVLVYRASAVADLIQGTPSDTTPKFSDWGQTADYAQDAIKDLAALELVNGYKDNTLQPKASATRGEAAQFLFNILNQDR